MGRFPYLTVLVTLFATLAVYQLALWGGLSGDRSGSSRADGNRIRLEHYVDNRNTPSLVLTGSSVIANLPIEEVVPDAINLGVVSGSVLTGLSVLVSSPRVSPVVVVETSETISRTFDTSFVQETMNPTGIWLRRTFSMFRTENKPINVLLQAMKAVAGKKAKSETAVRGEGAAAPPGKELQWRIAENGKPLSEKDRKAVIAAAQQAAAMIRVLEKRGSCVLLVRIPGDRRFDDTMRQHQIHDTILSIMPADRFHWIEVPSQREWVSNEGVHLVPASAMDFARYLKQATHC